MQYLKSLVLVASMFLPLVQTAYAHDAMSRMDSTTSMNEVDSTQPTIQMKVVKIQSKNGDKEVQIQLVNVKNGQPVVLDDLKEVHTQKIHLLIIDDSLEDYIHVHPKAINSAGMYTFSWRPKLKNANYKIWADLTPQKSGVQEYVMAELTQIGKPVAAKINKATILDANVAGYNFALQFDDKDLQVGKMIMGKVTITDDNHRPVTNLAPLMGAFAHIVGFYDDDKTIIHIHPLEREPTKSSDRNGPVLHFHMVPRQTGFVKLFVQVKINGNELYAPFGLTIE